MPSALVHFFSGTGNSERVARRFQFRLQEAGYDAALHSVGQPGFAPDRDLIVVVFPVYACAIPSIMGRSLHRFPRGKSKVVLVAIHGEVDAKRTLPGHEGASLSDAAWILRRKGYQVVFSEAIGFPFNATLIVSPPKENEQEGLISLADEKVERTIDRVVAGEVYQKPCPLWIKLLSWPFGLGFSWIGRRAMGKVYIADSACDGCGICAKACPVGAIRIARKKPRWNFDCQGCMRCINLCPKKAIQTSSIRLAAAIALFFLPVDPFLNPFLPVSLRQPFFMASLALIALLFFAYVGDKLFFLFELLPTRRFFEFNHTKSFRRYLAPGYKPLGRDSEQ